MIEVYVVNNEIYLEIINAKFLFIDCSWELSDDRDSCLVLLKFKCLVRWKWNTFKFTKKMPITTTISTGMYLHIFKTRNLKERKLPEAI